MEEHIEKKSPFQQREKDGPEDKGLMIKTTLGSKSGFQTYLIMSVVKR